MGIYLSSRHKNNKKEGKISKEGKAKSDIALDKRVDLILSTLVRSKTKLMLTFCLLANK